jgi:hypothetical protein
VGRGDALKAVGLALAALALNLALTTAVIFAYAGLVAPGRPDSFYTAQAPLIASWSAPLGGALVLFGFMAWLGRRRPRRRAFIFAAATWVAYVVLDVGSGVAMGGVADLLSLQVAISMLAALLGALAGAALSQAGSARQDAAS